jgi:hypothetical protein
MSRDDSSRLIDDLVSNTSTEELLRWLHEDLSVCIQLVGETSLNPPSSVAGYCLGAIKRALVARGLEITGERSKLDSNQVASASRKRVRVPPTSTKARVTRIMYVECKASGDDRGRARICRVRFSKSGRTIYVGGLILQSCRGAGISGNYIDVNNGYEYWVSGPKKNGGDRHWAGGGEVRVESDVIDEYWREIRGREPPENPFVA